MFDEILPSISNIPFLVRTTHSLWCKVWALGISFSGEGFP